MAADDDEFIFMTHAPGSLDEEVRQAKEELRREEEARKALGGTSEAPRQGPRRQGPPRQGPARQGPPRSRSAERPASPKPGSPPPRGQGPFPPPPKQPGRRESSIGRERKPTAQGSSPAPRGTRTQRLLAGGRAVTERLKARGQRATLRFHASKRELNETANLDALKRTFKALRRKPRPTTPIAGSDVPKLLPVGGSAPLPDAAPTASFLREFLGGILSGLQPAVWLSSLLLGILAAVVVFFLAWSPLIGLAALGVGGVWLLAWRVRLVNDVAKHKGGRSWPNWEQVPASFAMYLGLSLLFLPALACGIHSLGPDAHQVAAWDPTHPDSVFSKARIHLGGGGGSGRAFIGAVAEAAESYKDRVWGSQDALDAEREAQGVRLLDADTDRKRAQAEVAIEAIRELAGDTVEIDDRPWREVLETQLLGLRAWLEDPWDTPGRVLLLVALALFPMGLLVSARLQTAYTVFNPLLLVLSILRTPLTYASVVTVFLAADLLLVGVVWVVPPTATAALGASAGPGVSALVIGVVAVWACTVSGGVLGRYYRSRSEALGW